MELVCAHCSKTLLPSRHHDAAVLIVRQKGTEDGKELMTKTPVVANSLHFGFCCGFGFGFGFCFGSKP